MSLIHKANSEMSYNFLEFCFKQHNEVLWLSAPANDWTLMEQQYSIEIISCALMKTDAPNAAGAGAQVITTT